MAAAITAWQGSGGIVTPTNNLVAQYSADFTDLSTVRNVGAYGTAAEWRDAKAQFAAAPRFVANYFTYLAHRNYRRVMVFDEAHRLIPTLQDQEAIRLWEHDYPVPDWVRTTTDLLGWAAQYPADVKLARLATRLASHPDTYCVDVGWDRWRGQDRRVWTLRPLTPRGNRPVFWPAKVKKLVLMSATLYPDDLWELGLETRRCAVISVGSPIPSQRRRVVYSPCGNPAWGHTEDYVRALGPHILALAARHANTRGFVHTTYSLAAALQSGPLGADPRFVFHTPATAGRKYQEWLSDPRLGQVFVGCGMSEGLDLAGDRARWQCVTKIGYLAKSDPAVLAKMAIRPDWYTITAMRQFEQEVGRVCRGPADQGTTYVTTQEWPNLYRRGQELGLWSPSLVESLCTEGV